MATDKVRDLSPTKTPPAGSAGQTVVPAQPASPPSTGPSIQSPASDSWMHEVEEYLLSRGWEKLGMNERGVGIWNDMKGVSQKAELLPGARLPMVGGGEEIIKQWHCPPIQWECTTEEALARQKARDMAGENADQTIARKEKELAELKRIRSAGVSK